MSTEAPPVEPIVQSPPMSESLLSSIRVIRPQTNQVIEPEKPLETEPKPPETTEKPPETPEPEKKEETPKEEPKAKIEVKEELPKDMSEKARERFKEATNAKVKAEKERDEHHATIQTLRKEYDDLKKQAGEMEALRKDALKAIEEAKTYREQLRSVAIERDPEFKKEYDGQILSKQTSMLDMASTAGADRALFIKAINAGDEDALEGFRDLLPAHQQRAWDNARLEIDKLADAKRKAIGNPDETWHQIEENRKRAKEAEQTAIRNYNVETARNVVKSLWETDELKNGAPHLRDELEEWLTDAVVNEPQEKLIHRLAISQITTKVVEAQKEELDRLTGEVSAKEKEIEELKEKLGEQETFIKNAASHVPRPSIHGNGTKPAESGSLLSSVRVRLPGQ